MAVDKLVDSSQLDADLTSVANAIRTKGGTSAALEFPSGFVTAIGNISGGGVGGGTLTDALKNALEEIGFTTSEFTVTSPSSGNYISVPHTLGRTPTEIIAFCKTPAYVGTGYMFGCCTSPGTDADTNRTYMCTATAGIGGTTFNAILQENTANYMPIHATRTAYIFCSAASASTVSIRNQSSQANAKMYGSTWILAVRDSSGE